MKAIIERKLPEILRVLSLGKLGNASSPVNFMRSKTRMPVVKVKSIV
jgi:hypothetical protein